MISFSPSLKANTRHAHWIRFILRPHIFFKHVERNQSAPTPAAFYTQKAHIRRTMLENKSTWLAPPTAIAWNGGTLVTLSLMMRICSWTTTPCTHIFGFFLGLHKKRAPLYEVLGLFPPFEYTRSANRIAILVIPFRSQQMSYICICAFANSTFCTIKAYI